MKNKYQFLDKVNFPSDIKSLKHSDLKVLAKGDTHIDLHHTTEDTGIAIGECLKKALRSSKGIKRFAHSF